MLRLEKANGKNVWELLKLRVSDDQRSYVASNNTSIIEAYTAITGNGYGFPFGIYDEDTPVGFLMIGFDGDDYWDDAPAIAKGNYNLWRLMIDERYQGRGYGREAVRLALDFIRTWPSEKMPNAHLYQGDFTQGLVEPLLAQNYDFIVATYSLHHLTDEQKVCFLRMLCDHLNPGGQVLIGDVAFEHRSQLEQCQKKMGDEWDDDEIYFVVDELKKVFSSLKFTQISYCAGIILLVP